MSQMIALIFFLSLSAIANDSYPTQGFVYNTKEAGSLEYNCGEPKNGKIVCKFMQSAVRQKLKAEKLPALIEKDKIDYKKNPLQKKDCDQLIELKEMLEGKRPMPNPEKYLKSTELSKSEFKKSIDAMEKLCKEHTLENYLALTNIEHFKNIRTCQANSYSFEQTFKLVSSNGNGKISWVTESQPTGPCGVVQLSRFESESTKIGNNTYINWNYVARKAITNPSGELTMGLQCGDLDQGEYFYDWRPEVHQMSCDYVEFSPI